MINFTWGSDDALLHFSADADWAVSVRMSPELDDEDQPPVRSHHARQGMVEVLAVGQGRGLTNVRTTRTSIGDRLRYVDRSVDTGALVVRQRDALTGLESSTRFTRESGVDAYRVTTTVTNAGTEPLLLQTVSTIALAGITSWLGATSATRVWSAQNEWCSESRWSSVALAGQEGLPDINTRVHAQAGRGLIERTGSSTWSSGCHLPVSALTNTETGHTLVWQIEVSGPWHWEINSLYDSRNWISLMLSGPTDLHHSWLHELAPGASFETVPVSLAMSTTSMDHAVGQLTAHRRLSHLLTTADEGRELVFNDYMNALMGDPTTAKLLPLIDAAAAVGAKFFCIDAGWYDDDGDWWPSVGAWEPSTVRFGDLGLPGVLSYIRDKGLRPGLWVEPEVIGVRSRMATELPDDAFMTRHGRRIVEHDRYFLDFRSASARDYLDAVFARLIDSYGSEYFKLDYNVTPGTGPDANATSPGEGLLDHVRAHLEWFERLRERHPHVVFEACSSGAQRQDHAILSRFDLQSTSDQQDYRLYPTIAAAAAMVMPAEQAGNWAYPQSEMTDEQIAFNLVTGLSGRMYLAGNMDRLSEHQLDIVREAVAVYTEVMRHHERSVPVWPIGLPGWDDDVVAVGSRTEDDVLLFVWNRTAVDVEARLPLDLGDGPVSVETVFPTTLPAWDASWDRAASTVILKTAGCGESARVVRARRT